MATKKDVKKVSFKSYVLALLVLVGGIVLVLYIFEWYQVKQEEKVMNSYLLETNTVNYVIDSVDLYKDVTAEAPNDYFIFIGFTGEKEEYDNEVNFKEVIDEYEINDIVYYIDVTDLRKNDDYINVINKNLDTDVKNVPAIIYVRDGKIAKDGVISADMNNVLSVNNFEKLLDIYEFEIGE